MMRLRLMLPVAIAGLAAVLAGPVHAATMKECAAQWQEAKKANTTGGKTYRDFSKDCMSKDAATTTDGKAAPADTKAATDEKSTDDKAATDKKSTSKMSPGRQAMIERERACGAEWKADKAAGKVAAGVTWPKYWSECNTRKKASAQ